MTYNELLDVLKRRGALLLMFDFDGTLVEIAPTPDDIKLNPELLGYIDALSRRPKTNVAVLSGRTIDQLETYIPASMFIALAGSHGAVIRMPGKANEIQFNNAVVLNELAHFARILKESVSGLAGILIEEKGASVAMHFRLAEPAAARKACRLFSSQAAQLTNFKDLQILEGKKIMELRTLEVNKGLAVRLFCDRFLPSGDALVVYFGDDTTDIDAFGALPKGSIRVAIGKKISSLADYVLESPQELLEIIRRLLQ